MKWKSILKRQKEYLTDDKIIQLAKTRGTFNTTLRYRDDWVRAQCNRLINQGRLTFAYRVGNQLHYRHVEDENKT